MLRVAAAVLLVSIGCSPALLSPVDREEPEIEEMKARILELQRQARVSEVELDRLRRQVAELEASRADEPGRASDPSDDQTERAPTPVLNDRLPGDGRSQEPSIESSDIPPPPPTEFEAPAQARSVPIVTIDPGPLSADAQELYDRGYTFYHRSQYVDAESAFQQFLSAHPNSELADNAHYWIGESRFARTDYRGALAAFRETLTRYPDGNKVPDALLKAADCLARLGDVEGARQAYEDVVSRFPASAAAVSAEERRTELR